MDPLPSLLAVAAGVALLACRPRYAFVVRLERGEPRVASGEVTAAFLEEVREVCQQARQMSGWLGGVRQGHRIKLTFSHGIPPPLRQRLRNVWMLHG